MRVERLIVNPFRHLSPHVDAEVLRLKELHLRRVSESSTLQEGVLIMISKLIEMTRLLSECIFTGDTSLMDECDSMGGQLHEEEKILTRYLVTSGLSGDMWRGIIRFPYRLERIGDMLENILRCSRLKADGKIPLSDEAKEELRQLFSVLLDIMHNLRENFGEPTQDRLEAAIAQGEKLANMVNEYRSAHWERLEKGICAPDASSLYGDILDSVKSSNEYLEKMCASLLDLGEGDSAASDTTRKTGD